MFKNEGIDRYMHCKMQNFKKMYRFAYTLVNIEVWNTTREIKSRGEQFYVGFTGIL